MKGKVLDIGGKRIGKRGSFCPPRENIESWKYVNIDKTTDPDFCCSADSIPLPSESVDTVMLMEVLEYLPKPLDVFREIHRIANQEACILVSTPLLNPIHGDYHLDRARYSPVMLRELAEETDFSVFLIEPMGSVGAVIYDILRVTFGYANEQGSNKILSRLLKLTIPIFKWIDKKFIKRSKYINTGYFMILKKKSN